MDDKNSPPHPPTAQPSPAPSEPAPAQPIPPGRPVHGAYVIVPRYTDGVGLKRVIFDTRLRDDRVAAPSWQRRVHDAIMALVNEVNSSDLTEDRKTLYIEGLAKTMSNGCVKLPATPEEPPQTEVFIDYVGLVRKEFERDVLLAKHAASQEIFSKSQQQLIYFVPTLLVLGVLGTALVTVIAGEAKEIGNYLLAAAASVAGIIAFDWMTRPAADFEEAARREREIRNPVGRILFTVILTIAICLAVSSGAIKIELGDWETAKLGEQSKLAIFVGFLCGIPTSFLAKKFIAWIFTPKPDQAAART